MQYYCKPCQAKKQARAYKKNKLKNTEWVEAGPPRPGEMIRVKEGHINLDEKWIVFPDPKERVPKFIPLLPEHAELIQRAVTGHVSNAFRRYMLPDKNEAIQGTLAVQNIQAGGGQHLVNISGRDKKAK